MRLLSLSCVCKRRDVKTLKSILIHLLFLLAAVLFSEGCPEKCVCSSQTVKCQNQNLSEIPHSLPTDTKSLYITGNNILYIDVDSFPNRLDHLTDLYLSGNEIEFVASMVFDNLPNLLNLDLSNNNIQTVSEKAFPEDNKLQVLNLTRSLHNYSTSDKILSFLRNGSLLQLTVLDLSHNDLVLLSDNLFTNLPNLTKLSLQNSSIISILNGTLKVPPLRDLDLRDNDFQDLPGTTVRELGLKPNLSVRLEGNPWRCDCFLEDTLLWLRNSTQVADVLKLTCANPERLRRLPLLRVELSQLKCSVPVDGVLETSYVFLGLVLALIGVIFLLVLYLNRKGIKRWMHNIRDACRDHMEGYHYSGLET